MGNIPGNLATNTPTTVERGVGPRTRRTFEAPYFSTTAAAAAGLLGVFVVGNLASTAAAASASDLIISFLQPH